MEPKIAKTMAEWGYRGPGQSEPGGCVRCGDACCTTEWDGYDGLYYCVGRCDANAVHPAPGYFDATSVVRSRSGTAVDLTVRSALDRISPYEVRIGKEMGEWKPTPEALARATHRATGEQAVFFNLSIRERHFDLLDELQRRMLIAVAADVLSRWDEICAEGQKEGS